MIVSPQEYNSLLYRLTDPNKFTPYLRIPEDEPIYKIDLQSRTIEAPNFLSVSADHDAEVLWFKVDRFYENYDLFDATILVQYINANKEKFVYLASPVAVNETEIQYQTDKSTGTTYQVENILGSDVSGKEQILIPWPISNSVAKKGGVIEFAFQFFQLYTKEDGEKEFYYLLNTQSAKSKILTGINNDSEFTFEEEAIPTPGDLQKIQAAIDELKKEFEIYWIKVE